MKCPSLAAATNMVTQFASLKFKDDGVEVFWLPPRFYLPTYFEVTTHCQLTYNSTCASDDCCLIKQKVHVASNVTSILVGHVLPGSVCHITLIAVYNPAAIDSGITTTFKIALASEFITMYIYLRRLMLKLHKLSLRFMYAWLEYV